MPRVKTRKPALGKGLKEALIERLLDDREWLAEILAEVLEDFALGEAARKARKGKFVSRDEIFRALRRKT